LSRKFQPPSEKEKGLSRKPRPLVSSPFYHISTAFCTRQKGPASNLMRYVPLATGRPELSLPSHTMLCLPAALTTQMDPPGSPYEVVVKVMLSETIISSVTG